MYRPATSAWEVAKSATCSASTNASPTVNEPGVLTGKRPYLGRFTGFAPRQPATVPPSLVNEMLKARKDSFEGKPAWSPAPATFAIYTIEKIHQLGGKCVACSDSNGMILPREGSRSEPDQAAGKRSSVAASPIYVTKHKAPSTLRQRQYLGDTLPGAMPSATQNEINGKDAATLVKTAVSLVGLEGATMPTTPEGRQGLSWDAKIAYGPGKARNAPGVWSPSALEMEPENAGARFHGPLNSPNKKKLEAIIHGQHSP